jgi:hypothetical protein
LRGCQASLLRRLFGGSRVGRVLRGGLESRLLHYSGLNRLLLHLQLGLLLLRLLLHLLELAGWLGVLLELLAGLRNGLRSNRLLLGIASHLGLDGHPIARGLGRQKAGLVGEGLLLRWCLLLGIHVLLLGEGLLLAGPGSVATAQEGAGAGEHGAEQAADGI